uniref:SH3 domain-binding glutamic acid-rich-like protein 3 n=1 Tax=Cynoglossus semilaevis TaxID=244447 RepID=A0A3P8W8P3_CYNSE
MPVIVFWTSVSSNTTKGQHRIFDILSSLKIPHKAVDISQNSDDKDQMREIAGNPTALAPQICNGEVYCGDLKAFEEAVEMDNLQDFLRL